LVDPSFKAERKRKDRGTEWAKGQNPLDVGVDLLIPVLFMLQLEAEQSLPLSRRPQRPPSEVQGEGHRV